MNDDLVKSLFHEARIKTSEQHGVIEPLLLAGELTNLVIGECISAARNVGHYTRNSDYDRGVFDAVRSIEQKFGLEIKE